MKYLQRIILFFTLAVILFGKAQVFADDFVHVVGRGDTVYSISRFYGVSNDELMRINRISDPSKLQVGSRLVIPVSPQSLEMPAMQRPAAQQAAQQSNASQPAAQVALSDYRVLRGDTLFSIARTSGITLQALLEINRFSSNHVIKAGDVIKVPARGLSNAVTVSAVGNTQSASSAALPSGIYALRWPIAPKEIAYMTGQMGVVVEGERFESVKSLTQGNVISAGPWRKFGRVVIVETAGGYFYMYGGCETLSVNVGDRVSPGMEVGKLGVNTVSEKPQLFFMVFRSDIPIDPVKAPRAGDNIKT
ncbi:MAG: LysM peptidoglycan-binding domain-containing protein [Treponema sp.]|nr:LysM peptidoglycan-binding domain-containing protein [Treponema sp.]